MDDKKLGKFTKSFRYEIQEWVEEINAILDHRNLSKLNKICDREAIDLITNSIVLVEELEEKNVREVFIKRFQVFCESFTANYNEKGVSDSYVELAKLGLALDKGYEIVSDILYENFRISNPKYAEKKRKYWSPVGSACYKAREIIQIKREALFSYIDPLNR